MANPAPAVSRHYDQIGSNLLCHLQDLDVGIPGSDMELRTIRFPWHATNNCLELGSGGGFHLREGQRDLGPRRNRHHMQEVQRCVALLSQIESQSKRPKRALIEFKCAEDFLEAWHGPSLYQSAPSAVEHEGRRVLNRATPREIRDRGLTADLIVLLSAGSIYTACDSGSSTAEPIDA